MNVWFILHFLLNVEFYSECVGSLFVYGDCRFIINLILCNGGFYRFFSPFLLFILITPCLCLWLPIA